MNGTMEMELQALRAENARLRAENEQLRAIAEQYKQLLARVAELEEQLRKNSRNSSKPPSSDFPGSGKRPRKPKSGVRRGGQDGHPGAKRELLPAEQVDEIVDLKPDVCDQCGHPLAGEDASPYRHQVTEIPPIRPHVTEYRLHTLTCPDCGLRSYGRLPGDVPRGAFGFRLQGLVALFSGGYHLSKRSVLGVLADVLGVRMSLGSVSRCEREVAAALAEPVAAARAHVQEQPVVNADETGWREGGQRAWMWVAVTEWVTVFLIHGSRGKQAAQALLGGFAGVLGSDRRGAYNPWNLLRRQFCWAHLLRDFLALSERPGESARIGQELLATTKALFDLWHGFRNGLWSRDLLRARAGPLRERVRLLLEQGARCSQERTAGTCRQLLKGFPALWTFLQEPGVEPTNNAAERALRRAVLWRKGCFGTDSDGGSRFVERILTVTATCRQQDRNALEFVVTALRAARSGQTAPSLLPKNPQVTANAA